MRKRKGSGEIINAVFMIITMLAIMLIIVSTFIGTSAKTQKIIFDEIELMRTKNTFYLVNRSLGMTWFISTAQTIFKAENGVGEEYWYKTDPRLEKNILLPELSKCISGNPRICLPRSGDVADFLKEQMQGYLNIKGSDRSSEKTLNLNDVKAKIENIDISEPNNFWLSYDRITSLVTQKLTVEFGTTKSEGVTNSDNAIFTKFRKMVVAGWLVVDFAIKFSKESEEGLHDYQANDYRKYLEEKDKYIDSQLEKINDWLQPDAIIESEKLLELIVPDAGKTDGIMPAQSGLLLHYDLSANFIETAGGIKALKCETNNVYDDAIKKAVESKSWEYGTTLGSVCPPFAKCAVYTKDEITAVIKGIINQESGWDPDALSSCGAAGLMQLMPETARGKGLSVPDYAVVCRNCGGCAIKYECNRAAPEKCSSGDERFDPEKNIQAGVGYLDDIIKNDIYTKGDKWNALALALAAYNAGRSSVDEALNKAKSDLWSRVKQFLPLETQNYIPAVLRCFSSYYVSSAPPPPAPPPMPQPVTWPVMSCPMDNGRITCGSLGSGNPVCTHCSSNYGYACDMNSDRKTAIDVVGSGNIVYLPEIQGMTVKWRFLTEGYAGNEGGEDWGYFKVFIADSESYMIRLLHIKPGNPVLKRDDVLDSGDKAGELWPYMYITGPHVHITVHRGTQWDNRIETTNNIFVKNPEIELGLCSGQQPSQPPQQQPPPAQQKPAPTIPPSLLAFTGVNLYYKHDETNNRFEKAPFTLNVKAADYLPVLDCSKSSGQYSWLTEKDMLCYGNSLYVCENNAFLTTTRNIEGMNDAQKKSGGSSIGISPNLFQCITDCAETDKSRCLPVFCKEHDDQIDPRENLGKQCCESWKYDDGGSAVWKGGAYKCNGNTYCFGDGYTDKNRGEVCDYRNACGPATKDETKQQGCNFYCDSPGHKWSCKLSQAETCATDAGSDAAINTAYEGGSCNNDCGPGARTYDNHANFCIDNACAAGLRRCFNSAGCVAEMPPCGGALVGATRTVSYGCNCVPVCDPITGRCPIVCLDTCTKTETCTCGGWK